MRRRPQLILRYRPVDNIEVFNYKNFSRIQDIIRKGAEVKRGNILICVGGHKTKPRRVFTSDLESDISRCCP